MGGTEQAVTPDADSVATPDRDSNGNGCSVTMKVLAGASVRDGPSTSADTIGKLQMGDIVHVLEEREQDGHTRVRIASEPEGAWCSRVTAKGNTLLEPLTELEIKSSPSLLESKPFVSNRVSVAFEKPIKYRVLADSTVRKGPEKTDDKIGEHPRGTIIDVIQKVSNSRGIVSFQTITPPKGMAIGGWVKLKTSKNKLLLELLADEQVSEPSPRSGSVSPEMQTLWDDSESADEMGGTEQAVTPDADVVTRSEAEVLAYFTTTLGRDSECASRAIRAFLSTGGDPSTWLTDVQAMQRDGELDAFLEACSSPVKDTEPTFDQKMVLLTKRISEMEAAHACELREVRAIAAHKYQALTEQAAAAETARATTEKSWATCKAELIDMTSKAAALAVQVSAAQAAQNAMAMVDNAVPSNEIEKTFEAPGPIGIGWRKNLVDDGRLRMQLRAVRPGSIAEAQGVQVGWQLVRINGSDIRGSDYNECIDLLKSVRPVTLTMVTTDGVLSTATPSGPRVGTIERKIDVGALHRAHRAEVGTLQSSNEQLQSMLLQMKDSHQNAVSSAAESRRHVQILEAKVQTESRRHVLALEEKVQSSMELAADLDVYRREACVAEQKAEQSLLRDAALTAQVNELHHCIASLRSECSFWVRLAGSVERSQRELKLEEKRVQSKVKCAIQIQASMHAGWRRQVLHKVLFLWFDTVAHVM